jgi:hypothetical protein
MEDLPDRLIRYDEGELPEEEAILGYYDHHRAPTDPDTSECLPGFHADTVGKRSRIAMNPITRLFTQVLSTTSLDQRKSLE